MKSKELLIYFELVKEDLRRAFLNKGLFAITTIIMMVTLLTSWDENLKQLSFFGISFYNGSRDVALQSLFIDWFNFWWILLIFIIIYPYFLVPLNDSFSISNLLWLKLNNSTNIDIAFSRVIFCVVFTLIFVVLATFWTFVFAIRHSIWQFSLLYPILGILSFLILTSGITLMLNSFSNRPPTNSILVPILAVSIPIILSLLDKQARSFLGDNFPNAMPFSLTNLNSITIRAYISSIIIGVAAFMFHLIMNYVTFKKLSHEKKF